MTRFVLLFLLSSFLLLCGCGTNKALINGEWIEVLSSREEMILISTARTTLSKTRRLTSGERELIRKTEPELRIRYTADRTGDAHFIWQLPKKRVSLMMRGTFFTNSVQWVMKIQDKGPEFVDFSKQPVPAVEKK